MNQKTGHFTLPITSQNVDQFSKKNSPADSELII